MTESAIGAVHGATLSPAAMTTVQVPYGASLSSDASAFEASLGAAQDRAGGGMEEIAKAAFEPLDLLNKEARMLGDYARTAVESGNELTPAEIVSLTVQSQKFLFHSQLTANVANRTSDGIQQLFRQQG
jgi:hypothetical protein